LGRRSQSYVAKEATMHELSKLSRQAYRLRKICSSVAARRSPAKTVVAGDDCGLATLSSRRATYSGPASSDRRAGVSSGSKIRLERLIFLEATNTHDAKADDMTLRIHAFHKRVVFRLLHVAGGIRKPHFEIIRLRVEPHFYFIGHKSSPALGLSVK